VNRVTRASAALHSAGAQERKRKKDDERRKRFDPPADEHARQKLRYKDMTVEQQCQRRHAAFVDRMLQRPLSRSREQMCCVACLDQLFGEEEEEDCGRGNNEVLVMACDHLIHLNCFRKHAIAHMELCDLPTIRSTEGRGLSALQLQTISRLEAVYKMYGAPCPACRLADPVRHLTPFHNQSYGAGTRQSMARAHD